TTAGAAPPKLVVSNSTSSANTVTPTPIQVPTPEIPTSVFGAFDNIKRNEARLAQPIGFTDLAKGGLALEPSVYLDQKARYLNHLQELRRINEGDDTADSPGYSLNLVRVPISVLPGKQTDRGYGAEVTMTLTPYLSDELLPTTFRNLIINDLVDQIGVPLTALLNDSQVQRILGIAHYQKLVAAPAPRLPKGSARSQELRRLAQTSDKVTHEDIQTVVTNRIKRTPPAISATRLKHAKRPFPPSQMLDIYGEDLSAHVARTAYAVFDNDLPNTYYVHYPDVQGYLQEELDAAYKFLAHPTNAALWQFCTPELVAAIRGREKAAIANFRVAFEQACRQGYCGPGIDLSQCDTTKALAWAIIVE